MKFKFLFSVVIAILLISGATIAQGEAPSDIRSLIGARGRDGEMGLRRAGFTFVKTTEGSDRKWSYWWSDSRNLCIQVTTYDGRYQQIITTPAADCNRSGGPTWGGGGGYQQINPPSWARGTWYGTGPRGERIVLTINNDGEASANVDGNVSSASFTTGNVLYVSGNGARVTRSGNSIVTTRLDNGERITYSRNDSNAGGPIWGGGGGYQQINPPSWARGTWYGTGPRGERIVLTINNDGEASANVDGNVSSASFTTGNVLYVSGNGARVTRSGNSIVTTRLDNGERITYSRNDSNVGGPIWGGGGGMVSPPSWARGTFYGTGPQGQRITLIINSDGRVSADIDGTVTNGIYMSGDRLNMNGAIATVSRNGNGLTTVRTDNGESISYSRSGWGGSGNGVNVSDLVGVRASSGESEMRSRGFRLVDSIQSPPSAIYTIWWRSQSRQCIQIATVNGRYDSVTDIGSHQRCR